VVCSAGAIQTASCAKTSQFAGKVRALDQPTCPLCIMSLSADAERVSSSRRDIFEVDIGAAKSLWIGVRGAQNSGL
jgi:hypothetical protein